MTMAFYSLAVLCGLLVATLAENLEDIVPAYTVEDFDSFWNYIDFWLKLGINNSRAQAVWIQDHHPIPAGKIVSLIVGAILIIIALLLLYRNQKQRRIRRVIPEEIVLFERRPNQLLAN